MVGQSRLNIIAEKEFAVLMIKQKLYQQRNEVESVSTLKCAINHCAVVAFDSLTMLIARIKLNYAVLWGSFLYQLN